MKKNWGKKVRVRNSFVRPPPTFANLSEVNAGTGTGTAAVVGAMAVLRCVLEGNERTERTGGF